MTAEQLESCIIEEQGSIPLPKVQEPVSSGPRYVHMAVKSCKQRRVGAIKFKKAFFSLNDTFSEFNHLLMAIWVYEISKSLHSFFINILFSNVLFIFRIGVIKHHFYVSSPSNIYYISESIHSPSALLLLLLLYFILLS